MVKQSFMKQCLAGILSFAMTVTMLPAGAAGTVQAAERADEITPVLHYDMSHGDGKLTDISGNHLDGKLNGITDADFTETSDGKVLNFDGTSKNVEIPSGVIKNGGSYENPSDGSEEAFTIETVYTDNTQSTAWLFTLGTGAAVWNDNATKNYLFVSPCAANQGNYTGKLLGVIAKGEEKRYSESNILQGDLNGENILSVVFDNGDVTYYLNGKKSDVTQSGFSIQDILAASNTDTCIGYIGKSLYAADANFKGTVSDFKIFDQALTEEQVMDIHDEFAAEKKIHTVKGKLLEVMLNENTSVDEVTTDLAFPEELEGVQLTWTPSDATVFDGQGNLLYDQAEWKTVTVQVTGTYQGKEVFAESYILQVINKDGAEYEALIIANMDNIKGNVNLPATGKFGSEITWRSSNNAVVNPQADGEKPAGVVTRPAQDTQVTLTATLKQPSGDREKTFQLNVKAKVSTETMTDYVFAYFIGNDPGEEEIYLATSRDGLNWEELNKGEPVLKSQMGTTGLRDPFIMRSPEGDKFYLVATDLRICTDWDWTAAQKNGSQAIMVWESDDLVHWTDQRMVTVSASIEAGCTWAPEVFYDDVTGEYMVFWSSKVKTDNYAKQRLYYCKTRDFYHFTEPQVWIDESHSTIDTTVVQDDDGMYYRFNKNESETFIYMEKSESLLGTWTKVNEKIASGVEGPCCFKFNEDDVQKADAAWCLLQDNFGNGGYYPMVTDDLASGTFTRIDANLPKKPRHGTVMNITAAEYDALMDAYGDASLPAGSLPTYVATGYTLPEKVEIQFKEERSEVAVTWDKTADDFKKPGKVTATATIPSMGNKTVTAEFEVISVSEDLIYFIDAGVGAWNQKLTESGYYNAVKSAVELRNQIPDQLYTEGSWGFVNSTNDQGEYIVAGNRTSEKDSIYENGWWAKSGKNCEYILPLEQGVYTATGYFGEWWNVTRPIKFYVQYINDDGQLVKSEEVNVQLSSSGLNKTASVSFTVENVADTAEVHFLAVKGGSEDPVIAGLAVEKMKQDQEKPVTAITLDQTAVTMTVGDTATLKATIVPADATYQNVTWESTNEQIATVQKGTITAKAEGTTQIKAIAANGLTAVCEVTVTKPAEAPATGVILDKTKMTLEVGEKQRLTATINPENATDKSLKWASSDTTVATVDSGKVTAKAPGTATITVKTANNLTASCEVTVTKPAEVPVASVTLNKSSLTLEIGKSETLTATVNPADATDKKVTWESSDIKVATVENGKVTAKAAGSATITVKAANNQTASCKVTVNQGEPLEVPVTSVTLNKSSLTLEIGKSETLTATVNPADATDKKVTWESSDIKVATVENGKVTAKAAGTATITVKAANDKTAVCQVTVKKIPVTKVTLNKTKVTLGKGETITLSATVKPGNATNKNVTWSVEKKSQSVAKVSQKGVVTAKKTGKAVIVAKADKKTAKCTVTVKKAPKSIKLKADAKELKKGKKYQIKVQLPKNTASNKISYKSSNEKVASVSSSGKVTAKKKGKATITVKTFNNKKAKIKITVK